MGVCRGKCSRSAGCAAVRAPSGPSTNWALLPLASKTGEQRALLGAWPCWGFIRREKSGCGMVCEMGNGDMWL